MILLGFRVKRKVAARFGQERMERGLGWYAAMRSLQMRFMQTTGCTERSYSSAAGELSVMTGLMRRSDSRE